MGKTFKDPPMFSKSKDFDRWKTEIEAWKDVVTATNTIHKDAIGQVLALSLPDSDEEGDLRGKVMDAIGATLKGEGGYAALVKWLEDHLGQDKISKTVDKIRTFMKYVRTQDQSVKEYIAGFDAKYNAAVKSGLAALAQPYLMWLVVENGQVSDMEHKVIMSGIDLTKEDTLYTQAKASMMKYLEGPGFRGGEKEGLRVKNETLFAKTPWVPKAPYRPRFPMGAGGGYRPGGAGALAGGYQGGPPGFRPRTPVHVPRNPVKNGKQTLCDVCGSWTHFKRECPLNPRAAMIAAGYGEEDEYSGEAYVKDEDFAYISENPEYITDEADNSGHAEATGGEEPHQDFVANFVANLAPLSNTDLQTLYTTYDVLYTCDVLSTCVLQAGVSPKPKHPGEVVLDTGCIESVSSDVWVNGFIRTLHPNTRERIKVEHSRKRFRFGGGQTRDSMGTFHIPCSLEGQNLILVVDVVKQDCLPCLLSKKAMKRGGVLIDVGQDKATIFGKIINLDENDAGHYVVKLDDFIYNDGDCSVLYSDFEGKTEDQIKEDVLRMHKGLGHPSRSAFERMLKNAGTFNNDVILQLNKLYSSCETCLKHRKTKPIPKVAPPLSQDVNDTLTIDLKIYGKLKKVVLYMIDDFSRFVTAVTIPDKRGETVVKAIMDKWIFGTPYGPPRQIISDNGLEFVNASMRSMCDQFGIKHITSAAYSAHQNGLNERNHFTCDMMVQKIMDGDPKIKFEDALSQAVFAKNTLLNVHGYSPSQILTGKQPRAPGATADNTPAQDEEEVDSRTVQKRINLMQKAREAFTKVDNSNRLKRAMRVQPSQLEKYETGEMLCYRFGTDPRWFGPGRVIGQENKVIYIKHGGHIISTSQSRVYRPGNIRQMVPQSHTPQSQAAQRQPKFPTGRDADSSSSDSSSDSEPQSEEEEAEEEERSEGRQASQAPASLNSTNESEGDQRVEGEGRDDAVPIQIEPDSPAEGFKNLARPDIEPFQLRPDQVPEPEQETQQGKEMEKEKESVEKTAEEVGLIESEEEEEIDSAEIEKLRKKTKKVLKKKDELPKKGNWILYKEKDQDVWFRARVMGKGVKSTSKLPYYNISPEFENTRGVNLDDFDWCFDNPDKNTDKVIYAGEKRRKTPGSGGSGSKKNKGNSPKGASPKLKNRQQEVDTYLTYFTYADQITRAEEAERVDETYVVFIPKEDWEKPFVLEAKEKELKNFENYGAYKVVRDVGQPRMSTQWIITEKMYGDVKGAKARVVVNGNQEKADMPADSPTVSKQSLRLLFTLAAQMGWEVVMADATSAFLQSDNLDRELYVQPPKDAVAPGHVWLLVKPMYGLTDASLKWYQTLADRLIKLGCKRLTTDPAMFYWQDENGKLAGLACWHVDDMLACGTDEFYLKVLTPLMKMFTFGSTSEGKYRCLGWNVMHRHEDILVSQKDYIETKLDFLNINTKKHLGTEKLDAEEASMVRAMIGKLRWLSDQCRPDIAIAVLELSLAAHSPTYDTVKLVNKTVAQVVNREYYLRYSRLNTKQWYITVFSDASLRGLPDKISSAMGYIILLSEGFRPGHRTACNVLSWKSCKTRRIVASTYDAETLALAAALEEGIFIKEQLTTMLGIGKEDILIEAYCDCNDSVAAITANKPLPNKQNRLAALEIARIKEMIELKMINSVTWCPSAQQLADTMTKRGASTEPVIHTVSKGKFFY